MNVTSITPQRIAWQSAVSLSSFQALYSYVPQNEDELELQEGDLVSVMEKCDDGWFVGMCHISLDRFPTDSQM